MKPKTNTLKKCKPRAWLLIAWLVILPACAQKPQVPGSLPTLPVKPSISMPPMPSEILTGVQADLQELEKRRLARVQRLTP